MQQRNILILCTDLNIGGAQAVAANISKYAPDHLRMTYLVFREQPGDYEPAILSRGDRVLHWPSPSAGLIRFFLRLLKLLRRERFDAVHCHTMFNCGPVMLAARLAGVPVRISHSHTIREERPGSPLRSIYRCFTRTLIRTCSSAYWACGREAGYTLYGRNWFDRYGRIIPNGIDREAFRFSGAHREAQRRAFGLEDRFLIGHAGHYAQVKNQKFLIECMPRLLTLRPDAVLLLFGSGPDRPMLEERIRSRGRSDHVRLMGHAGSMAPILSAFDVFAFPSLFEGTPLALIEAQTNGLPCIISDRIPDDAIVSALVTDLPLEEPERWCQALAAARRPRQPGALRYPDVREAMAMIYEGYEINSKNR